MSSNKDEIVDRSKLLEDALSTKEGRMRLAATMVAPLRGRMSYQSVGRRAFGVDPLWFCEKCGTHFGSEAEKESHAADDCLVAEIMLR